jgi:cytochrome c2
VKETRLRLWLVVLVALGLIGVASLLNIERRRAQLRVRAGFLPGNPRRGGELFYDRGCAGCHAISGVGGKIGADLARPQGRLSDLADVAAAMWNHAPEMWQAMAARNLEPPRLTPTDLSDLLAFLFAAGYLEEEGNPVRGEAVLADKGCLGCHAANEGRSWIGPDLARWSASVNPIVFSQLLWNHGPAMEEAMKERGVAWPPLDPEDVADLLAYLRRMGSEPRRRPPLPGDPVVGRAFFRSYCQQCHQVEGRGGSVGPELGAGGGPPRTLSALAASLWNHSPAMGERMKEMGVNRPSFNETEISHLITYLFAVGYFEGSGDPDSGKQIYDRSCEPCHGDSARGGMAPSLQAKESRINASYMSAALWNHGPRMYQEMKRRSFDWPELQGTDMRNLIAYLRSVSAR